MKNSKTIKVRTFAVELYFYFFLAAQSLNLFGKK